MTIRIYLLSVLLAVGGAVAVQAGTVQADSTIVARLQDHRSGGKVVIYQSKKLEAKVGRRGRGSSINRVRDVNYLVTQGYRIQVFSGNNQRKSKAEAERKEKLIKELTPELETYVQFKSPFWQLRVGNYRSYEEADQQLRMLRKAFPSFGKEMYIVREEVQFPIEEF